MFVIDLLLFVKLTARVRYPDGEDGEAGCLPDGTLWVGLTSQPLESHKAEAED